MEDTIFYEQLDGKMASEYELRTFVLPRIKLVGVNENFGRDRARIETQKQG